MTTYLIRRVLWIPPVMLAVALVTFVLGLYGPGDPVETQLGTRSNPAAVARLRAQWGLDQPFHVQFIRYIGNAVRGDFGESYKHRIPVGELIGERMWVSIQLAVVAMAVSFALGVPLGLYAAVHQGTWIDRTIISTSLIAVSLPVFVSAPIVQYIFVRELKLLPAAGWEGILSEKIILPVLVLGLPPVAGLARQTRSAVLDVLGMEYVTVAAAKGLSATAIRFRHVLRNALIPVVTIFGFFLASLPTGALIVEFIFGIPGIGGLAYESITARDYPVIMATTLVGTAAFLIANLLVDVAYTIIDPRIRYA